MTRISRRMAALGPVALMVALFAGALANANEQVNVNTADAQTIARTLSGVGMSKAEAIVAYREANGRFNDPYELTRVRGIGESTVRKNEERIVISEASREKKE